MPSPGEGVDKTRRVADEQPAGTGHRAGLRAERQPPPAHRPDRLGPLKPLAEPRMPDARRQHVFQPDVLFFDRLAQHPNPDVGPSVGHRENPEIAGDRFVHEMQFDVVESVEAGDAGVVRPQAGAVVPLVKLLHPHLARDDGVSAVGPDDQGRVNGEA